MSKTSNLRAEYLTERNELHIRLLYDSGLTPGQIRSARYPNLSLSEVRAILEGVMRGQIASSYPTANEVAQKAAEIRSGWDAQTLERRWVGRYSPKAECRGHAWSQALRQLNNGEDA